MRKYLRRIAYYRMRADGVRRINRPILFGGRVYPSYFKTHWREVVGYPKKGEKTDEKD